MPARSSSSPFRSTHSHHPLPPNLRCTSHFTLGPTRAAFPPTPSPHTAAASLPRHVTTVFCRRMWLTSPSDARSGRPSGTPAAVGGIVTMHNAMLLCFLLHHTSCLSAQLCAHCIEALRCTRRSRGGGGEVVVSGWRAGGEGASAN